MKLSSFFGSLCTAQLRHSEYFHLAKASSGWDTCHRHMTSPWSPSVVHFNLRAGPWSWLQHGAGFLLQAFFGHRLISDVPTLKGQVISECSQLLKFRWASLNTTSLPLGASASFARGRLPVLIRTVKKWLERRLCLLNCPIKFSQRRVRMGPLLVGTCATHLSMAMVLHGSCSHVNWEALTFYYDPCMQVGHMRIMWDIIWKRFRIV